MSNNCKFFTVYICISNCIYLCLITHVKLFVNYTNFTHIHTVFPCLHDGSVVDSWQRLWFSCNRSVITLWMDYYCTFVACQLSFLLVPANEWTRECMNECHPFFQHWHKILRHKNLEFTIIDSCKVSSLSWQTTEPLSFKSKVLLSPVPT